MEGTRGKSGSTAANGVGDVFMAGHAEQEGLGIQRFFTRPGEQPLEQVTCVKRSSLITDPDGSVIFKMDSVEVPEGWSQLATDIVVSKYFRKAGVQRPEGTTGSETGAPQVIYRVAHTLREAGERLGGYFSGPEEAETFEAELTHLLLKQMGAFNSPVWFNCGLSQVYGIRGKAVGNWAFNPDSNRVEECPDAYTHPQLSACFIQSIKDDLMDIADAVKREMRLFKFGSGTGTNFSAIRAEGELLGGGGTSSGLMSFLEVLDRAAGATKSGGTTRRAAKMVILDMDHPEIARFIQWKAREEEKAQALIAAGWSADFNGEVYRTVSGQNSNNSVRLSDEFMRQVEEDGDWQTTYRTTKTVAHTYKARELLAMICRSAWRCADPGVQFDTTINTWHTCARTDRINASNPCSEYMFLDDTACNLASLNLVKFLDEAGNFDVESYRRAIRIFFVAQEIAVDFASYPTRTIAKNSHDYRPLGLGFANLGTLLMIQGVPYDSDEGRLICGAITAITTGHAYRVSAEMARLKGPFQGYKKNAACMLKVMRQHRDAALELKTACGREDLVAAAQEDWKAVIELGEQYGFRNAQSTVLAPTGTIGLLMDCDTTGIEPDFSLVKFKKLAGGGYFKIINHSVPRALKTLGYSERQRQDILDYVIGHQTLTDCPHVSREALMEKGMNGADIQAVEEALPGVFDFRGAFRAHVLGEECRKRLGIDPALYQDPAFDLLDHLGFSEQQILAAELWTCGASTIEGAPHLRDEHLAIFDCANRCGKIGKRFIHHMGHIRMMAAAQPFISGAISKTINMPHEVTEEDIRDAYWQSWKLGLKAVALYRDGCKGSQPLSSSMGAQQLARHEAPAAVPGKLQRQQASSPPAASLELPPLSIMPPLRRRRLPKKRFGFTQEAKLAGHKIYLRTGNYDDGSLGEIFIDMHKEGAAFRSMMNCFAISVSMGLQYGVPLEDFVDVFTFTRFDPQGPVDHPNIKYSTSVIDYIFRLLAMEYLGRTDFIHVKPADGLEPQLAGNGPRHTSPAPKLNLLDPKEAGPAAPATGSESRAQGSEEELAKEKLQEGRQREQKLSSSPQWRARSAGLSEHLEGMMGDAPFCDLCGHITVRNGACYRCLNCGNSMGCS